MNTEDVNVNYKGFKPNRRTMEHMKVMADNLYYEAPSESFIKATFARVDNAGFMGIVKINSTVGPFVAKALGDDMNLLGENLFKQIRTQLKQWKATRFLETSTAGESHGQTS